MTTRTSIPLLIPAALRHGRATASSGRWWSYRGDDGRVIVGHYGATMLAYDPATGEVEGLSRGWGSMTDKCGIGKVLRGAGAVNASTYAALFA